MGAGHCSFRAQAERCQRVHRAASAVGREGVPGAARAAPLPADPGRSRAAARRRGFVAAARPRAPPRPRARRARLRSAKSKRGSSSGWAFFAESDYHVSEINRCFLNNHRPLRRAGTLDRKGKLFQNKMLHASFLSRSLSLNSGVVLKNKHQK